MAAQTPRAVSAVDRVIGARIRAYRHERGLSQGDLAAKLGLTFQQVQKYENGLNRVAASRLFEIASLLAVPLLKLFLDEGETKVESEVPAEVTTVSVFMATHDGWRLCRAFVHIADPDRRKKLIALVEDIADA